MGVPCKLLSIKGEGVPPNLQTFLELSFFNAGEYSFSDMFSKKVFDAFLYLKVTKHHKTTDAQSQKFESPNFLFVYVWNSITITYIFITTFTSMVPIANVSTVPTITITILSISSYHILSFSSRDQIVIGSESQSCSRRACTPNFSDSQQNWKPVAQELLLHPAHQGTRLSTTHYYLHLPTPKKSISSLKLSLQCFRFVLKLSAGGFIFKL